MYKVYDLKNRNKIIAKGTSKECAEVIECHITYIPKAAAKQMLIRNRYRVVKIK